MKKLIFAFAVFNCSLLVAQKKDAVPTAAKNAFNKEFPNTKAKWDIEKNGTYEAEFKWKGAETSATYDQSGLRLELEVEIKIEALPLAVTDYLKNKFPSQKIHEASKIVNDKNIVTYEAEIKKNGKPTDLLFDSKGNFLK